MQHFTEMCSGSEAGSYFRLIDFVYHSTPGLRVIKKKNNATALPLEDLRIHISMVEGTGGWVEGLGFRVWAQAEERWAVSQYMGASLIRNNPPLGTYSRPMPRALWWS